MPGTTYRFRYDSWCGWLLGLLGMGRRLSAVVVDDDGARLQVRMGWAFRGVIPIAAVTAARPGRGVVLAWGVHGWRGRWLVNGSARGLVDVAIDPPCRAWVCGVPVQLRELRVSVERPDDLVAAIERARAAGQDRW